MKRLGVITGLIREADCLGVIPADRRPLVRSSGARPARAYALSRELIGEGCQGLVSFGTAGGLKADLKPGTLVLAESVVRDDGKVFQVSKPWLERMEKAVTGPAAVTGAAIAGSDTVAANPEAKRALAAKTSAVAVDMESHAVARAAEEAGVPFLVVRVIADSLQRTLPEWILGTVGESGGTRPGAVLSGLARHPWDLPALVGLAGDNAKAMAALRRVAGLSGGLFFLE